MYGSFLQNGFTCFVLRLLIVIKLHGYHYKFWAQTLHEAIDVPSEIWYVKHRLNWALCDAFLFEER